MKKVLSLVAFSALMFAGCQNELETGLNGTGEESVVRITLQAPDAMNMTRAGGAGYTNSANGGITNVDWSKYDLRYQLAVYSADEEEPAQIVAPIVQTVQGSYQGASFSVRLVEGRDYRFVAWADFVTKGTTTDLHYSTADLTEITCLDEADAQLNDESRDAYFVTEKKTVNSVAGVSLTLHRPFAKVRVIATDWNDEDANMPDNFKITYYGCTRFTGLNAVTGTATESTLGDLASVTTCYTTDKEKFDKTTKDYTQGYEAESDKNRTLTVDYLFASPEQKAIHFKLETFDDDKAVSSYDLKNDIPMQRNYLTTILGNLLTGGGTDGTGTKVVVTCEEGFEEEYNNHYNNTSEFKVTKPQFEGSTVYIKTPGELIWLSKNALFSTNGSLQKNEYFDYDLVKGKGGYTFILVNDIDMQGVKWTPINWKTPNNTGTDGGTFDGNGKTIRNLNIDNQATDQGLFGHAVFNVIKNLTIENATLNQISNRAGALAGNLYSDVENCKVKHVFIRTYNYTATTPPSVIQIGGMIGTHNSGNMKNCTAEDVTIKGYHSVGGLVGIFNESSSARTYENCSVSNAHIWTTSTPATSPAGCKQIGSIIGLINGALNITLKDCTTSNIEYKVGPYNVEDGTPYIITDGEEGEETTYGPQHELYGWSNDANAKITITNSSSTEGQP